MVEIPDMIRGNAPGGYRADIDGLRAIAVTAVVLFHAGLYPLSSGYVGVDIFFVISGYLIGGIILREVRSRRFSFALFYARRARRILPALLTVVLAACCAGWFLLSPAQFRDFGATGVSTLLGMSNISFYRYTDYFVANAQLAPLLMTWSLGVEEQFYLFFPLLMFAVIRWAPRRTMLVLIVVTTVSFMASVWWTYAQPAAAFYLLPFRAWELGIGVILALMKMEVGTRRNPQRLLQRPIPQQALGAAGLGLLGISVCAFDANTYFPGFAAIVPVLGAAALIVAEQSWVNRYLLSSRPMVFVGLISYSWYLWHWPVLSFVRNVAYDDPPLSTLLIAAAVAFGLAILSWRFVEQPFRHGPVRVRPVLTGYAVALAVALMVPFAIKTGHGFPLRASAAARKVEAVRAVGISNPCLAGWDDDKPNLSPTCVVKRDGRPTIVLIGDSHAAALSAGVRALSDAQGWGYEILTKSSCLPLIDVTIWRREQPQQAGNCATFMQVAFTRTLSNPGVQTVLLAGYWPPDDADAFARYTHFEPLVPYDGPMGNQDLFRFGLRRAVSALSKADVHVVVLGDVPRFRFDVGQVALTEASPTRSALARWLWSRAPQGFPDRPGLDLVHPRSEGNASFLQSLEKPGSVTYLDLFPRFCPDGSCMFERNGDPLFIDTFHLSEAGARYALQDVRPP